MAFLCNPEDIALTYARHIEELHDFFRSRGVGFGASQDIAPAIERMSADGGFRDELGSMMRAIIYRQRDGLTPVELFELLAVAIGGAKIEQDSEGLHEPARELLGFVKEVCRSRWSAGVAMPTDHSGDGEQLAAAPVVPEASVSARVGEMQEVRPTEDRADHADRDHTERDYKGRDYTDRGDPASQQTKPDLDVAANAVREVAPEPAIFYRARVASGGRLEDDEDVSVGASALRSEPEMVIPLERFGLEEESSTLGPRRWLVIVGACVLPIAVGGGIFLSQHGGWAGFMQKRSQPAARVSQAPAAAQRTGQLGTGQQGSGRDSDLGSAPGQPGSAPGQAQTVAVDSESVVGRGTDAGGEERPAASNETGARESRRVESEARGSEATGTPDGDGGSRAPHSLRFAVPPTSMAGRLLYAPRPQYPESARLAHVQGRVVLQAVVAKDGSVVEAKAVSGHPLLRGAAEQEVYGRHYRPYELNDRPVDVSTLIAVNFRLDR